MAYQILNPGFSHWFSKEGDAAVGFVVRRGYRIVGGAPIAAPGRLAEAALEFESDAKRAGYRVCYFGAGLRLYEGCRTPPKHSVITLGAQPVWDPSQWDESVSTHASLRAQFSRALNKGVVAGEWTPQQAEGHPALLNCLHEWLECRPMPPMHFLVEPETLAFLQDRRTFVAEQGGQPVAFLIASPVPARQGWLVEQIVRSARAPNGTNELLVHTAARAIAAAGDRYLTLGLSPLSRRATTEYGSRPPDPLWVRLLLAWVREHGRRFYNFDGLDAFKAKFRPDDWEPIFAIVNEPRFSLSALYAIAAAFSDGSPISQIARALAKAARQEYRNITSAAGRAVPHQGNDRQP